MRSFYHASFSAPCGTPRMILPFRTTRKPRHGDCSLPHYAERSPGRLHHSAPCGTLAGTMFAFPRHAERRPDDIHASAPCGNLTTTMFAFPRHAETSPERFSTFRKTRKPSQVNFIVPYFEESRPKRFSPFLTIRIAARSDFAIPYFKESRPERFSAFLIIRIFAPGFVVPLPQFFGNRDRHGIQHVGGCNDGHHDAHGSRTCRASHGYARSVRYGSGRNSANSMTAASTNATTVPAVN